MIRVIRLRTQPRDCPLNGSLRESKTAWKGTRRTKNRKVLTEDLITPHPPPKSFHLLHGPCYFSMPLERANSLYLQQYLSTGGGFILSLFAHFRVSCQRPCQRPCSLCQLTPVPMPTPTSNDIEYVSLIHFFSHMIGWPRECQVIQEVCL